MTSEDDPISAHAGPRRFRRRRLAFGVATAMVVVLAGLWIARRPIAEGFIDRRFAAAKVPARYAIADLGLGRQRLTDVVIGDPAHPDLVADWIETRTGIGANGPELRGVRAGHVRLRGRLVGGAVSLGAIDRLLPAPSGKPFALPDLDLTVADARMRLDTPQGVVGLKLSGSGGLADGFRGQVAAISERLERSDCVASRAAAVVRVAIAKGSPTLAGPLRVGVVECGGVRVTGIGSQIDATLGAALDRWRGRVELATAHARTPVVQADRIDGWVRFDGGQAGTRGTADLTARDVTGRDGAAAKLGLAGAWQVGATSGFAGKVRADGAGVAAGRLVTVRALAGSAAGTPVAPLVDRIAGGLTVAARDFSGEGAVAIRNDGAGWRARLSRLTLTSKSGAHVALAGGSGVTLAGNAVRIDTAAAIEGGGLPRLRATLAQATAGAPVRGVVRMAPYAAGTARLALTPVAFTASPSGAARIATRVTLSGPMADGRIDSLDLPIAAEWGGRGGLTVNRDCATIGFDRLAVAGLTLGRTAARLCPVDGAMLRMASRRVGGGVRLSDMRLGGKLGTSPLTIAAKGATMRFADRAFAVEGMETRIGPADRSTRLDFARLEGALRGQAVMGRFEGGAGQVGAVPLLLSGAAGDWSFAKGTLTLNGALAVADAQTASPRFRPMAARGATLTLKDGRIAATGALYEPTKSVKVADLAITHALGDGRGHADLKVAALSFTKDFQPDLLTPLTFGVIADVRGTIDGGGAIDWNAAGVTSTGTFRTAGTDLAAAFGPVTGLAGAIRFTDLLALESAPAQEVRIKTVNPGIAVNDGVIRFQTYRDARVLVNSGRWPFAGGTLTLDPTLLDFSRPAERRMTFHVDGAAADQFLQQFDFKNLDATGIFDGVLPMIFDDKGGRIEGGALKVRAGGGGIAYVGDLSQKDLGLWGNLAFGALKSLRYRSLAIVMNGPLSGEMITEVKFAGISQGEGAKSNFLIRRLQRLPFVFNIRIKAPFRGLLDSAQSFYDPKRLIQRNLPSLLDAQNKQAAPPPAPAGKPIPPASAGKSISPAKPIQPSASETVP